MLANKGFIKNPKYTKSDVKIRHKESGYAGFFDLNAYTLRHCHFNGEWGNEITREVFERGHAVGILPYDHIRDEVVLIEQFRPGAFVALKSPWFADDASPWLYEAVAGIIDPGESPADVAYRETIEEAGTTLSDLIPVCHYLVSPGSGTESVFVFVRCIDSTKIEDVHGVETEGEDIRPFTVRLQEAYDAIASDKINNGMTIIALQWLMLNKEQVLTKWS